MAEAPVIDVGIKLEEIVIQVYLKRADSTQYDGNSLRYNLVGLGTKAGSQEFNAHPGFAILGKILGIPGVPSVKELEEHGVILNYNYLD